MSDDHAWSVSVDRNVLVWEFPEGMELSEFGESAWNRYVDLLDRHDVRGMVTVVEMDDPFDADTFEVWQRSARKGTEEGIERWAVVADGIKAMSVRSQLDVPELSVETFDTRDDATEWARNE
jgi:hypothetical protein